MFRFKRCFRIFLPCIIFTLLLTMLLRCSRRCSSDDDMYTRLSAQDGTFLEIAVRDYLRIAESALTAERRALLKRIIDLNREQKILNDHLLPNFTGECFLIQVHNRQAYLALLIESLQNVRGIENVLLVFSHDFYDEKINELVRGIKFAPVMQIFYPYSCQIHFGHFPCESPNDCGEFISKAEAERIKCNNWRFPDTFGHYRNAKIVQIKHHWWWKINFVMQNLKVLQNKKDLWVTLLEEDFFIIPDALYVLKTMRNSKHCQGNSIIVLGSAVISRVIRYNQVTVYTNTIASCNLGISLNRIIWDVIKTRASEFCRLDEYNWDIGLFHVLRDTVKMKVCCPDRGSRVVHLGTCGIHQKMSENCTFAGSATAVREQILRDWDKFFPMMMFFAYNDKTVKPALYGGWSDPRDIALCFLNSCSNSSL